MALFLSLFHPTWTCCHTI